MPPDVLPKRFQSRDKPLLDPQMIALSLAVIALFGAVFFEVI